MSYMIFILSAFQYVILSNNNLLHRLSSFAEDGKDIPGTIDKSTWGSVNYQPLLDGVWRYIGIHSHHQQRCENYVQMAALICKTLVNEERRTWRAIIHSSLTRVFNGEATERWMKEPRRRKRKDGSDNTEKKKTMRVEGSFRVQYFAEFLDMFMHVNRIAKNELGEQRLNELWESLGEKKTSDTEREELVREFEENLEGALSVSYARERESGFAPTAVMGGEIVLTSLQAGKGHNPHINDELFARRIPWELEEWVVENNSNESSWEALNADDGLFNTINFTKKRHYIKVHEAHRVSQKRKVAYNDVIETLKGIVPVGDMLKQMHLELSGGAQQQSEERGDEDAEPI